MKAVTIDANVIVKWIFPERPNEAHLSQAISLLQAIRKNTIRVYQPVHWLAETAAVVVRLQPSIAKTTVNLLSVMDFPVVDDPEIYVIACQLAEQFDHHLFDTLYHAVALYRGNTDFITADEKYYRKAYKQGAIIRLADLPSLEQKPN